MSRIYLVLAGLLLGALPVAMPSEAATPADSTAAPARPPILTLLTIPENAKVRLLGSSKLEGTTPLDLPATTTGRYSVVVQGSEFARTHGVIYLPPRGEAPVVLSESPGVSPALILRGFNFPGAPDLLTARKGRGVALAAGGLTAGFMAIHSHLWYRDRLDEVGGYAADRAQDEKSYRDSWALYGLATLGLSAIDYWIRPRFALHESTPDHLTLDVPHVSRGGAIWRSILVPGAGQEFGNHRTRSVVWLGGVLLFGAGYVVADYKVHRDQTDVKWAQISVDSAGPSDAYQLQLDLEQQERSLQASKDIREGAAIATAGWWALSIVDAIIMPLTPPKQKAQKVATVSPLITPRSAGMQVSYRF